MIYRFFPQAPAYRCLDACLYICLALGLSLPAGVRAESPMSSPAVALTLEQAMATAFDHNVDARLASLNLAGAEAAGVVAGAAPNPVLTLQSFNINPAAGIGTGKLRDKTVDSTVRIDQLIERGGKRQWRVEQAGHAERAAREDVSDARRQLRLALSQAYYDWMAAIDRLAIVRESAGLFNATLSAAQKRQAAGDLAASDVARAQVDALRAANDARQAGAELVAARQNLALLMGGAELAGKAPGSAWPDRAPVQANRASRAVAANDMTEPAELADLADFAEGALQRRPDIRAAQARVDAALSARKLALAQRSADVTVGVQAEHYPASATNPQGSGNSFGIALQVPLQWRYHFEGEIRAADVALDTARANLDKLLLQARGENVLGSEQAGAAWEKLRRCEDSLVPAARKAADAAEFAFQRGALGIMDLLDTRRSYRGAQLDTLAARVDYAKALAAWHAANSDS